MILVVVRLSLESWPPEVAHAGRACALAQCACPDSTSCSLATLVRVRAHSHPHSRSALFKYTTIGEENTRQFPSPATAVTNRLSPSDRMQSQETPSKRAGSVREEENCKCLRRNGSKTGDNRAPRRRLELREAGHKNEARSKSLFQDAKTNRLVSRLISMSEPDEEDESDHQTHPISTKPTSDRPRHRSERSLRAGCRRRVPRWPVSTMSMSILLLAGLVVTCCALAAGELAIQQARQSNSEARKPETNFHLSSAARSDSRATQTQAHDQVAKEVPRSRLEEDELVEGQQSGRTRSVADPASAGVGHTSRGRRVRRARPRAGAGLPKTPSSAKEANSAQGGRQAPQSRDEWQQTLALVSAPGGRLAGVNIKNVTAQNGQSVILHCFVEPNEQGETGSISWFRGATELQLLTSDEINMVEDHRFTVRRGVARDNDWALQLSEVARTDTGLYQCQTSDERSPQLQAYYLTVVEPQASIVGAPDLAVKLGAAINLTCVIAQSADELQFVFWYRDSRIINYELERERRGKIVLTKVGARQEALASQLQIYRAQLADSANFTCAPSGAKSTSVQLHVLEAADKRLIMFQNDDTQQRELFAASSQQTNSAISNHLIKLSRGRVQALLFAYIILASWFHLVAQVQTCISLALLAVIGFLLSHTTERRAYGTRPKSGPAKSSSSSSSSSSSPEPLDGNEEARRKLAALLEGSSRQDDYHEEQLRPPSSVCQPGEEDEGARRGDSLEEDPLISSANTALHLLRSLTRNSAHSHCSASESIELETSADTKLTNPTAHPDRFGRLARVARPRATSAAQSSPSGSSSSSTGYNSDSRPAASVNLLDEGHSPRAVREPPLRELEDELEMIELLRNEPSAMCLIMEQLRANKSNQQLGARPLSKQLDCSHSAATFGPDFAPDSAEQQSRSLDRPTCPNNLKRHFFAQDFASLSSTRRSNQAEPIYSIPTPSGTRREQLAAPSGESGRSEESATSALPQETKT